MKQVPATILLIRPERSTDDLAAELEASAQPSDHSVPFGQPPSLVLDRVPGITSIHFFLSMLMS